MEVFNSFTLLYNDDYILSQLTFTQKIIRVTLKPSMAIVITLYVPLMATEIVFKLGELFYTSICLLFLFQQDFAVKARRAEDSVSL